VTDALRFAVIGSPVAHSKSPAMHAAAYRALGMPHVYEKLETSDAELASRVDALRRGDWAGLNVTVPHKQRVLSLVDEVDASARIVGAANTLVRCGGKVVAHNTDAAALVEELAALAPDRARLARRTGVVVGAGGASRAAIAAMGVLGIRRVIVLGRGLDDAERALAIQIEGERILAATASSPTALATTNIVPRALASGLAPTRDVVAIVQATSCGMTGAAPGEIVADALDWSRAPPDAIALDVVYAPRDTPFLARARARGLAHANGLGMLARQGALAFRLWLGVDPPLDAMLAAIA
jgi:shikimate dehydrogenase